MIPGERQAFSTATCVCGDAPPAAPGSVADRPAAGTGAPAGRWRRCAAECHRSTWNPGSPSTPETPEHKHSDIINICREPPNALLVIQTHHKIFIINSMSSATSDVCADEADGKPVAPQPNPPGMRRNSFCQNIRKRGRTVRGPQNACSSLQSSLCTR